MEEAHWDVPDWSWSEEQQLIAALKEDYDKGALFIGAFDGAVPVGMSVLDDKPMPSGVDRYNLMGLWVSHHYRGRGIGKTLFQLMAKAARERGAKALYVSATPSENTVRFYQSLGFELAELIDPDLFEKEPDDIPMAFILR